MVAILLSISDRIISTEFSIARTSEYERSLLYSEGFINNVISLHDNIDFRNCVNRNTQTNEFSDISSCFSQSGLNLNNQQIDNQQLKVYARATQDNRVNVKQEQTVVLRLVENFASSQNAPVIGNVVVDIRNCSMNDFIFTRVGWDNNNIIVGKYKGVQVNIQHGMWKHVENKQELTQTSNLTSPQSYRTFYISARYIGDNANCQIGLYVYDLNNSRVIASTRSLEILLQSDVYLGSNSLVYFRLPTGGRTFVTDSIYDYVYFEL